MCAVGKQASSSLRNSLLLRCKLRYLIDFKKHKEHYKYVYVDQQSDLHEHYNGTGHILTLEVGTDRLSWNVGKNYHYSLCNIPAKYISHDSHCMHNRNNEARSRNHCLRKKETSITYSECVCI